ncbi:hypothetical protein FLONG3_6622 [Fusarium longipes]|uniref:DNA repair rad5 n=1 Tax=Fusarium longipes TaxID=694270 RepID=A0A395SJI6_9HYPO|nr:hypothetical protein FLONG3_6622 [Fusarium longipes]
MDLDDRENVQLCKRIRLLSPEPDAPESDGDALGSDCDGRIGAGAIHEGVVTESSITKTDRDVCLGVIAFKATSSYFQNRHESEATVDLRKCGNILKLYTSATKAYAGIVTDLFPSELLYHPSVKLRALLRTPASLRITISSTMEEATEIGSLLSKNSLFLQHPSPREIEVFELDEGYFNPHYLVTPVSRMPQLEDLAIECNDLTSDGSIPLDDKKKGQLMSIFDTAADIHIRPTTKQSPRLQTRLKDHQLKALAVMSEKECANVENPQCSSLWAAREDRGYRHRITGRRVDVPPTYTGGILADEMGLGKTLSVLSLICWSLDCSLESEVGLHDREPSTTLIVVPKSMIYGWQAQIKKHIHPDQVRVACYHGSARRSLAKEFRNNDIVLTTYQTLRSEWTNEGPLFERKWFRIVLDEGTPIQNSIDNYGALLAFINIEPLGIKDKFYHWISKPIRDNEKDGLRRLRILVEATCLRRTKSSILQRLPPPTIREDRVELHAYDRTLHDSFRSEAAKIAADHFINHTTSFSETHRKRNNVMSRINTLRRICDHGEDLLSTSDAEVWRSQRDHEAGLQSMSYSTSQKPVTSNSIDAFSKPSSSTKVQRLIHNIRSEQTNNFAGSANLPVKSVVFSHWTKMLDLVQEALLQSGFLCVRVEGKCSTKQREDALSRFAKDPSYTIMLLTIGSGGEGIDLTSANHVHLLEPHWNPMAEKQAIARVHRIGQQRPVTATRYITPDSIEEKLKRWLDRSGNM